MSDTAPAIIDAKLVSEPPVEPGSLPAATEAGRSATVPEVEPAQATPASNAPPAPAAEQVVAPLPASSPVQSAPITTDPPLGDTQNASENQNPVLPGLSPANSNPQPKKQGRHPKGCKCGRCIQSGGTGGYDAGGTKRSATAGTAPNAAQPPENPFADILTDTPQTGTDYAALAGITFDTATGVLCMVIGPEWKAQNDQEKLMVCGPLAAYMKSKGMTDLPPGVMLTLVCLAYSAGRVNQPNTRQKLQGGWIWIKTRIGGLFRRKP